MLDVVAYLAPIATPVNNMLLLITSIYKNHKYFKNTTLANNSGIIRRTGNCDPADSCLIPSMKNSIQKVNKCFSLLGVTASFSLVDWNLFISCILFTVVLRYLQSVISSNLLLQGRLRRWGFGHILQMCSNEMIQLIGTLTIYSNKGVIYHK